MPSYAKQNISAQLHIRLDPLKLPRDPLKVVAGSKHGAQHPQKPYFWGGGGGERLYIYLLLHCHYQNDLCIKVGSDESHFNVS